MKAQMRSNFTSVSPGVLFESGSRFRSGSESESLSVADEISSLVGATVQPHHRHQRVGSSSNCAKAAEGNLLVRDLAFMSRNDLDAILAGLTVLQRDGTRYAASPLGS